MTVPQKTLVDTLNARAAYLIDGVKTSERDASDALLMAQAAVALREAEQRFKAHTEAIMIFLNELYGIMVDPCAEGVIKVQDMKDALIKAALRDRENRG